MKGTSSATLELTSPRDTERAVPFEFDEFRGEVATGLELADLEREIVRMVDPASAVETLHWGRNYLYAVEVALADGVTIEVVVKQFRNQGLLAGLRKGLRGSKAEKNWRAAQWLEGHQIQTPRPLLWVESKSSSGPSFFISHRVQGYAEMRHVFRALQAGEFDARFPKLEIEPLLVGLAKYLRGMHDAGLWHRDISIGNVLYRAEADGGVSFQIVDLNRARTGSPPGLWRVSRDLSRLPIVWPDLRRLFLEAYWGRPVEPRSPESFLFTLSARAFLLKHWFKNNVRQPVRSMFTGMGPRRAHAHIPDAPEGATSRDKIVWDRLSDQPHQHASSIEKSKTRFTDLGQHVRAAGQALAASPRIWSKYRELRRTLYSQPVEWNGVGVAVRPLASDPSAPVSMLDQLGVRHVMLRLHPWQDDHSAELELATALHERGYELAFGLPQNRELVRDPKRWRSSIETLAELFVPLGRSFQVGQAVNRSKWGVWTYAEYLDLAASAAEVLRAAGDVQLLGPSVIDFEPHATAGLLNLPTRGLRFDAVGHLLYVDRRGAPENPQLGLDTVGKLALMHAIAATGRNSSPRSWITEFNWPLREGPHSPAGREVAVDEESQASYMVRYYISTLATGLVERVYWWQLLARGYGLAVESESGEIRRRPSYWALGTLTGMLEGAKFVRLLECSENQRLFLFERGDDEIVVGWSVAGESSVELPRPACSVTSRDGCSQSTSGSRVELSASPSYWTLEGL